MTIIIMVKKAEREAAFQDIVTAINNAVDSNNRQEATRLLEESNSLYRIMKHARFGQRFKEISGLIRGDYTSKHSNIDVRKQKMPDDEAIRNT